jgi:hypothetical protein
MSDEVEKQEKLAGKQARDQAAKEMWGLDE